MSKNNTSSYKTLAKQISARNKKLSKLTLPKILILASLFLVIVTVFYFIQRQQEIRDTRASAGDIEYGFNTHLNATGEPNYYTNLDINFFRKTVDDLTANNLKWIRVNIAPWQSATSGNPTQIAWNENAMRIYDEAINYAHSKGLKIFLVTSLPDFANSYTKEDYKKTNVLYHNLLAKRYLGKITVWQIYNEADTHNFKGYTFGPELNNEYLNELGDNVSAVGNVIKQVDPNVKITLNVTGGPIDNSTFDKWEKLFNATIHYIDYPSFDVYPGTDEHIDIVFNALKKYVDLYNKPFILAETGLSTGVGQYREEDQARLVAKNINSIKKLNPIAIIYYQYADTTPEDDPVESGFGVVYTDGLPKSSYSQIVTALSNTPVITYGLLRIQTNPAAEASITAKSLATGAVKNYLWGADWDKLETGQYRIEFNYPNPTINNLPVVIPSSKTIEIGEDKTTTLVADLTTGNVLSSNHSSSVPPTFKSGLLRVETSPPSEVKLDVVSRNDPSVKFTRIWGIDWERLNSGRYTLTTTPQNPPLGRFTRAVKNDIQIRDNMVTVITINSSTGRLTTKYVAE